jgi:hypothetical protein
MMPVPALLLMTLQGAASGATPFPELAVREFATLRTGITAATWLAAHPGDGFTSFRRDSIRENDDRWCARASRVDPLPGGARITRYAYFYPPPPPASLTLPAAEGPALIREHCLLGAIWLEVRSTDSAAGSALAERTRDALTRVYGPVTPSPDAWFGRTPTDSQRRAISRLPGAPALSLGLHFFGAAGWRVPGRWQADSAVVVSAHDAGLGSRKEGGGRVLAFAFLPIAELGSFREVADRAEALERGSAALAAQAARLSGLDPARVDRLLDLLAAAESAYTGRHPAKPAALDSAAVAVLGDWIARGGSLPPPRRAAALLAADQVLGSAALIYVRAQREDSVTRRAFERLGTKFVHNELGGDYNYKHTWLDDARRLDPHGRVGTLATLALLRIGFDETGMCGGGSDAVITAGEQLLTAALDSGVAAEVHRLVGDAYADVVALAAGAGMDYADSAAYTAEAPAARRSAIAHYRQALTLDRSSPEARAAWLEGWRLLAGLPPTTTHFFCVYD